MDRAGLYPNEQFAILRGVPCIEWSSIGRKECPLALFLTGGGHLGRIAYGHPDGSACDFLAYWLGMSGYSVVVPSPPIEHPLFDNPVPELDIETWSEVLIDLVEAKIDAWGLPPRIIAIGWSMAGRFATRLAATASAKGIAMEAFVSLAATPPIPGLSPVDLQETPLTENGFRRFTGKSESLDFTPVCQAWLNSLSEQNSIEGRQIIAPAIYLKEFIGNSPLNLHGEGLRWRNGRMEHSIQDAIDDVLALDFSEAPLCAAVIPNSHSDRRHALLDQANWSFFNANVISARVAAFPGPASDEIMQLVASIPQRLSRKAVGGHFFFLGAAGASASAKAIHALHTEILAIESELKSCSLQLWSEQTQKK